jgi:hypothetical protein
MWQGILLHQLVTVKCELINQIEQWRKHIADGFIENSDFQHCVIEQ